jgi:hypothetical protein
MMDGREIGASWFIELTQRHLDYQRVKDRFASQHHASHTGKLL